MKELTLPATIENIETVIDFVNGQLEEIKCPLKAQMQIDIAIDELFGNIAHYAYNPETGGNGGSDSCRYHIHRPRRAVRSAEKRGPRYHTLRRGAHHRRAGNFHGQKDYGRNFLRI